VQQVANLHVVIDLSGCQLVGNPKKLRTSWQLVGNPGCQPGLATSFQLVRLVGCSLNTTIQVVAQTLILAFVISLQEAVSDGRLVYSIYAFYSSNELCSYVRLFEPRVSFSVTESYDDVPNESNIA